MNITQAPCLAVVVAGPLVGRVCEVVTGDGRYRDVHTDQVDYLWLVRFPAPMVWCMLCNTNNGEVIGRDMESRDGLLADRELRQINAPDHVETVEHEAQTA